MAYSDFTLADVITRFQLVLEEQIDLFVSVPELPLTDYLRVTLEENVPLALAVHTEKVRSELIIMPVLVEVRKLLHRKISLFSGVDFTVDAAAGLNGTCDFLVSQSPEQLLIRAPVITIVEAKKDNINSGLGQCIAEMVAAQLFNERAGNNIDAVYGLVTTGSIWKFLKLDQKTVFVDKPEYYLESIEKVLGILTTIAR